jgi:hypothetical protein
MRSTFRVQRAAFGALEIHLAREEIRQHGAQDENPAEHGYGQECVEQVLHELLGPLNPEMKTADSSAIVES